MVLNNDLKTSQLILLHTLTEEPRTSQEVVDYFAFNFPEFFSSKPKEGFLSKEQIFPMLRYLGKKEFIKRDRSERWMITRKGRGALLQNAFLTFRNVMQVITNPYITGILPVDKEIRDKFEDTERVCLSVEPLTFPAFPSPASKSRVQYIQDGIFYLIDLGSTKYDSVSDRIDDLVYMQEHLNTLSPDVQIFIGELKESFLCLNSKQELALEIEDESVDHIIVHYLFSLYKRPQIALEEIYRVLKPGQSVLMLEYTSDNSPFQIYQKELFSTDEVDLPHMFQRILNPSVPLTKENIISTIKKTSFEVVEVVDVVNLPRFVLKKPDKP
ncbi:MAG: class I SAM-dependent methyltransferase [Candidatus Hodarchaeales archaeon]|jgi:hypothetical protein